MKKYLIEHYYKFKFVLPKGVLMFSSLKLAKVTLFGNELLQIYST